MLKTILITGGTTRLGKVIGDYLDANGWRVIRSSHRSDAGADIVADLSVEGSAETLFKATCDLLGVAPNAIVNNAALFTGDEKILKAINYEAPIALTNLMAKFSQAGSVVNILDCRVVGTAAPAVRNYPQGAGDPPNDLYSKTKLNLLHATYNQAREFIGKIRVNGVAPGPVMASPSIHEKAGVTPFGRPTPQAVAEAVLFLLSAEFTTGEVISVDGGQSFL